MNSTLGLAWFLYNVGPTEASFEQRQGYLNAFVISPAVGAIVGAVTFSLVRGILASKQDPAVRGLGAGFGGGKVANKAPTTRARGRSRVRAS